ncbi:MAG: hypothetical protein M1819_005080 [Sarea resinae]|nr:MAG: hypothetical protein M1819_005080 [Sarea resinae]
MLLNPRAIPRSGNWICGSCLAKSSSRWFSNSIPTNAPKSTRDSKQKLPDAPVRTRFAPSPTGYLHLGSLRTALFNYLLAKSTGGQFLLRIEDTDQKRTIPDAEGRLYEDLRWAGLQWDEGPEVGGPYGPYRQSERTPLYQEHAEKLVQSGHAYRCFCSAERLHTLAKQRNQLGLPTDYDRTCASIPSEESQDRASKGEAHVIRLKVPDKYPEYNDIVYGKVRNRIDGRAPFKHGELSYEDPIIMKTDGLPTYHLANVVDDHHMKITHVIRAAEWMSSTPKHLFMYEAFNWQPPAFAHVGLLQDQNGQKLSKRKFDLDISAFRDKWGIFPEALDNYVALLGWSHSQGADFMRLEELVKHFDMKFTRGNTIVTFGKLWYLQKEYAQLYAKQGGPELESTLDRLTTEVQQSLTPEQTQNSPLHARPLRPYLSAIFTHDAKNYTTPTDFLARTAYFFHPVSPRAMPYAPPAAATAKNPYLALSAALGSTAAKISDVDAAHWNVSVLHERIKAAVEELGGLRVGGGGGGKHEAEGEGKHEAEGEREGKDTDTRNEQTKTSAAWNKALYYYLRWAIAGGKPGPGVAETMVILGREVSVERLREAAEAVEENAGGAAAAERT